VLKEKFKIMKWIFVISGLLFILILKGQNSMEFKKLTKDEARVILNKGTERPFSGIFYKHSEKGTYVCKQCGVPLYKSADKFDAHCGWPSFDDEIEGAVKRIPDEDGRRTEIVCNNCGGHLGHVFIGEGYTVKNTRQCVNSVSLNFIPLKVKIETKKERAVFASGCFWGTEHMLKDLPGVISTTVGYTGGYLDNPTYKQVCYEKTGHVEAVEVIYNSEKVKYETLAKLFFETHDPTQLNRQGPDIGYQYRSVIFYVNEAQKKTAQELIDILKSKGLNIVTELEKAGEFWKAEEYHQDYYDKTGKHPYCHAYTKRF